MSVDARADLVVVGGGIVGLATAYRLLEARPALRLVLLEKEPELATLKGSISPIRGLPHR
jgi:L-2-hydroxyglutarate oxidase LhgO